MQKNPKAERFTKRSFTWGIRSTDIAFMQVDPAQAALDGSANDCGCGLARFDKGSKKPAPAKQGRARSRGG